MLKETTEIRLLSIEMNKLKPRRLKDYEGNKEISYVKHPGFGFA